MALTQVHTHWNTHTLSQNRFLYCDRLSHSKIHTVSFKRCWCQNSAHLCPQDYWSRPESVCVFVLDTSIMRTYCLAPQIEDVLLYVCVFVFTSIFLSLMYYSYRLSQILPRHTDTHTPRLCWTNCWLCVCVISWLFHPFKCVWVCMLLRCVQILCNRLHDQK